MKQVKAVDKKGKIKKGEVGPVLEMFPEQYKANISAQFEKCFEEHNGNIKKEPNGCDSWIPFSKCFYEYGKGVSKLSNPNPTLLWEQTISTISSIL